MNWEDGPTSIWKIELEPLMSVLTRCQCRRTVESSEVIVKG